ncbi:hypothetical protein SFB9_4235 [Klebsiella michiganensis]|nr:hypothetical protein SFB9_4235 [Klebsiella michiganensis]
MMSLWDALRMNMMISYQELVRTFLSSPSGRIPRRLLGGTVGFRRFVLADLFIGIRAAAIFAH